MKRLFLCSSFADVANLLPVFAAEELKGKIVAFIPTASIPEEVDFYVADGKSALKAMGMVVNELEFTRYGKEEAAAALRSADYIYITGGNTFFLLQELKRNGLDAVIAESIRSGKPYIGESAGAIIMAPSTEYMKTVNFDPIGEAPELKEFSALGTVDFYPVPHYKEFPFAEKADEIIRLYDSVLNLYPITNKQALFVENSTVRIVTGIAGTESI